jgi:hypothetical protein
LAEDEVGDVSLELVAGRVEGGEVSEVVKVEVGVENFVNL